MMIVTGAAGFLGSCLISKLNQHNFNYMVAVDRFDDPEKEQNLYTKKILQRVDPGHLPDWLDQHHRQVEFIFHMNGDTGRYRDDRADASWISTPDFSKKIWQQSIAYQIPFLYISSATNESTDQDKPYNFNQWAMVQKKTPFFWAGLQLPEVYGPNEYYLGSKASIIYRQYNQWKENSDKEQPFTQENNPPRDLVYVKDVVEVCYYLMHYRKESGIYQLGTGYLYTEQQIIGALASALHVAQETTLNEKTENKAEKVRSNTYSKLRSMGYERPLTPLTEGVQDYVQHYLKKFRYF